MEPYRILHPGVAKFVSDWYDVPASALRVTTLRETYMTHREARQKLGSRTGRRSGTKTSCVPGASNGGSGKKQGATPKFKNHHAGITAPVAVRVRKILREAKATEVQS